MILDQTDFDNKDNFQLQAPSSLMQNIIMFRQQQNLNLQNQEYIGNPKNLQTFSKLAFEQEFDENVDVQENQNINDGYLLQQNQNQFPHHQIEIRNDSNYQYTNQNSQQSQILDYSIQKKKFFQADNDEFDNIRDDQRVETNSEIRSHLIGNGYAIDQQLSSRDKIEMKQKEYYQASLKYKPNENYQDRLNVQQFIKQQQTNQFSFGSIDEYNQFKKYTNFQDQPQNEFHQFLLQRTFHNENNINIQENPVENIENEFRNNSESAHSSIYDYEFLAAIQSEKANQLASRNESNSQLCNSITQRSINSQFNDSEQVNLNQKCNVAVKIQNSPNIPKYCIPKPTSGVASKQIGKIQHSTTPQNFNKKKSIQSEQQNSNFGHIKCHKSEQENKNLDNLNSSQQFKNELQKSQGKIKYGYIKQNQLGQKAIIDSEGDKSVLSETQSLLKSKIQEMRQIRNLLQNSQIEDNQIDQDQYDFNQSQNLQQVNDINNKTTQQILKEENNNQIQTSSGEFNMKKANFQQNYSKEQIDSVQPISSNQNVSSNHSNQYKQHKHVQSEFSQQTEDKPQYLQLLLQNGVTIASQPISSTTPSSIQGGQLVSMVNMNAALLTSINSANFEHLDFYDVNTQPLSPKNVNSFAMSSQNQQHMTQEEQKHIDMIQYQDQSKINAVNNQPLIQITDQKLEQKHKFLKQQIIDEDETISSRSLSETFNIQNRQESSTRLNLHKCSSGSEEKNDQSASFDVSQNENKQVAGDSTEGDIEPLSIEQSYKVLNHFSGYQNEPNNLSRFPPNYPQNQNQYFQFMEGQNQQPIHQIPLNENQVKEDQKNQSMTVIQEESQNFEESSFAGANNQKFQQKPKIKKDRVISASVADIPHIPKSKMSTFKSQSRNENAMKSKLSSKDHKVQKSLNRNKSQINKSINTSTFFEQRSKQKLMKSKSITPSFTNQSPNLKSPLSKQKPVELNRSRNFQKPCSLTQGQKSKYRSTEIQNQSSSLQSYNISQTVEDFKKQSSQFLEQELTTLKLDLISPIEEGTKGNSTIIFDDENQFQVNKSQINLKNYFTQNHLNKNINSIQSELYVQTVSAAQKLTEEEKKQLISYFQTQKNSLQDINQDLAQDFDLKNDDTLQFTKQIEPQNMNKQIVKQIQSNKEQIQKMEKKESQESLFRQVIEAYTNTNRSQQENFQLGDNLQKSFSQAIESYVETESAESVQAINQRNAEIKESVSSSNDFEIQKPSLIQKLILRDHRKLQQNQEDLLLYNSNMAQVGIVKNYSTQLNDFHSKEMCDSVYDKSRQILFNNKQQIISIKSQFREKEPENQNQEKLIKDASQKDVEVKGINKLKERSGNYLEENNDAVSYINRTQINKAEKLKDKQIKSKQKQKETTNEKKQQESQNLHFLQQEKESEILKINQQDSNIQSPEKLQNKDSMSKIFTIENFKNMFSNQDFNSISAIDMTASHFGQNLNEKNQEPNNISEDPQNQSDDLQIQKEPISSKFEQISNYGPLQFLKANQKHFNQKPCENGKFVSQEYEELLKTFDSENQYIKLEDWIILSHKLMEIISTRNKIISNQEQQKQSLIQKNRTYIAKLQQKFNQELEQSDLQIQNLKNKIQKNKEKHMNILNAQKERFINQEIQAVERCEQEWSSVISEKNQLIKDLQSNLHQYELKLQEEKDEKIKQNSKTILMIDKMKNDLERESKKQIDQIIEMNKKECEKKLSVLKEVLQQDYDFKCQQLQMKFDDDYEQMKNEIACQKEQFQEFQEQKAQESIQIEKQKLLSQNFIFHAQTTQDLYNEINSQMQIKFEADLKFKTEQIQQKSDLKLEKKLQELINIHSKELAQERKKMAKIELQNAEQEFKIIEMNQKYKIMGEELDKNRTLKDKIKNLKIENGGKDMDGNCKRCEILLIANGQYVDKIKNFRRKCRCGALAEKDK